MLIDHLKKPLDQLLGELLARLKHATVSNYDQASMVYVGILLTMALAYLSLMPVGSGDTDLWFHLNGGRLFWEFNQLPHSPFYSFMESERTWVNYYWGFQALSYQIHNHFGYPGLIALRVGLVFTTFAAITALLIRPDDSSSQRAWALMLLVLVVMVLVGRTGLIRPHLVSYMMITVFLLILEYRRRFLPLLPFLTVIWVNLHGVELPVGALICGVYFIEAGWRSYRNKEQQEADDKKIMMWTMACLPALLINPFGVYIVTAAFSTPAEVYDYIAELQPRSLWTLFSVNLTGPVMSVNTAVALLSWGNVLAYGLLFIRGRMRFAPLVLSLAGLILLSRGARFIWEWALLSLPIWRLAIEAKRTAVGPLLNDRVKTADLFVLLILLAPAFSWAILPKALHHWPLDETNLPIGTTTFLRDQQIEGRMMSPPNYGGYLAWKHYPKILNSGDNQSPPTLPWDHFRRHAAVSNSEALRRFIDEYRPNLISVELGKKSFPKLIKNHSSYRPVFFDDKLALYADASQLPELVERFELQYTNPFNLLDAKTGTPGERIEELRKTMLLNPTGDRVQHALTRLLFDEKRYTEALPIAEAFAASRPENPNSHYLLGNVLENLDRCEDALIHYYDAMDVAPADFERILHQHLAACAYITKDFGKAYRHFKKGLNPYIADEESAYLYQFAVAAYAVGDDKKARTLLNQLLFTVAPEETNIINRAKALLSDL